MKYSQKMQSERKRGILCVDVTNLERVMTMSCLKRR